MQIDVFSRDFLVTYVKANRLTNGPILFQTTGKYFQILPNVLQFITLGMLCAYGSTQNALGKKAVLKQDYRLDFQ